MTEAAAAATPKWKSFAALSLVLSGLAILSFWLGPKLLLGGARPSDDPVSAQLFFSSNIGAFSVVFGVVFALAVAALISAVIQLFRFRQAPVLGFLALLIAFPLTLFSGYLMLVVSVVRGADAQVTDWTGVPAPELSFTTIDGDQLRLSDLEGKRVLINHWATWCAPCRAELPSLIRCVEESDPEQVALIGLSVEETATVREAAPRLGINYPLVALSQEEFGSLPSPFTLVPYLPTSFVIDRNGIIQKVHVGVLTHDDLVALLVEGEDYQGPAKAPPDSGSEPG